MNAQKIPLAIQRRHRKVVSAAKAAAAAWGEEEVHQFRVEVKKLRAFLRLAGAARTGVKAALPGKLRVFYSMAGVIRTLQLQRKGLEEAAVRLGKKIPDACSAYLEGRLETAVTMAKLYLKQNTPLGHLRGQWYTPMHAHMPEKAAAVFIRERKGCLDLSGQLPDEQGLHAIRKSMKDILYAWPCLFGHDTGSSLPEKWQSKAAVHKLTDLLGDFLDISIQLRLLEDSRFLLIADKDGGALPEELRRLWQKDKEEKLEQLRHTLLPTVEAGPENPLAPGHLTTASYELHVD